MDIETLVITIYISICTVVFFPFAIRYQNRAIKRTINLQKKYSNKEDLADLEDPLERLLTRLAAGAIGGLISLVPPILLFMIWREEKGAQNQEKRGEKEASRAKPLYDHKLLIPLIVSNSFIALFVLIPLIAYPITHASIFDEDQIKMLGLYIPAGMTVIVQIGFSILSLFRTKVKFERAVAGLSMLLIFPIALFICVFGACKKTKELDNLS